MRPRDNLKALASRRHVSHDAAGDTLASDAPDEAIDTGAEAAQDAGIAADD
jgi:hypothetical protein